MVTVPSHHHAEKGNRLTSAHCMARGTEKGPLKFGPLTPWLKGYGPGSRKPWPGLALELPLVLPLQCAACSVH